MTTIPKQAKPGGGAGRVSSSPGTKAGLWAGLVLLAVWVPVVPSRGEAAELPPARAPIFVVTNRAGGEELTPLRPADGVGAGFLAVVTNEWPAGLIPLFFVEGRNGMELRRRPLKGQENFTEPVFFILPPADDPAAARLAGRWDCRATRADGSKSYVIWELTADGNEVAGRFDQRTEYRVAFVAGGSLVSNRFELRVDYINDSYLLDGDWSAGKLAGRWRHTEDMERGTWEAIRLGEPARVAAAAVALYEWRRVEDGVCRYRLEDQPLGPGWRRVERPLGRVWKAPASSGDRRQPPPH